MIHKYLTVAILLVLFEPAVAADIYTIKGSLSMDVTNAKTTTGEQGDWDLALGARAFPGRTHLQIVKKDWLGFWNTVITEGFTDAAGNYTMTISPDDPNVEYRIRVFIETYKGGLTKKQVTFHGKFVLLDDNIWSATCNSFLPSWADANKNLTLNLTIGNPTDADGGAGASRDLKVFWVDNPLGIAYNETHIGRFAGMLWAINSAYCDVKTKMNWLGTLNGQDTNGQLVFCPGISAGGISWPDSFETHILEKCWTISTAVHEFGHIVHYHSTDVSEWDLIAEIWGGHNEYKKTNLSIAYCEGWPEFFEREFAEAHAADMSSFGNFWDIVPAIWQACDYNENTKVLTYKDGKDHSGEVVEGAIGRTFTQVAAQFRTSGTFLDRLEPVWSIVRAGAGGQMNSRNSMKTFKPFYDAWLNAHAAADQGIFRKFCDENGIVYSRMYINRIAANADTRVWKNAADALWVSAKGKIESKQLGDGTLHCDKVDEWVSKAHFGIMVWPTDPALPWPHNKPWSAITDSEIPCIDAASSPWKSISLDSSAAGFFYGIIDAAALALPNGYYMIVSLADEVTINGNTTSGKDQLTGPYLRTGTFDLRTWTPAFTGDITAPWWHGLGMIYQVKLDKVAPKVEPASRKPAAN